MPVTRFHIRLPSVLAGRYVRYVMGFGVAVGVGMAPFLGNYKVPLFESLLELFQEESKTTLIPISAFLMGLVAVAIQFYAGENIVRKNIRRRFAFGLAAILVAFGGLVAIYGTDRVISIPVPSSDPSTKHYARVILGWSRAANCDCRDEPNDLECAYDLGMHLETCWPSIPQVRLSLYLLYLTLTGGFGSLIGLLLLQEEARRQEKKKKARPPSKKSRRPRRAAPKTPAAGEAPGSPEPPPQDEPPPANTP